MLTYAGALPMIVVSSCLATAYTAYGGLLVSIVTDQLQVLSLLALLVQKYKY